MTRTVPPADPPFLGLRVGDDGSVSLADGEGPQQGPAAPLLAAAWAAGAVVVCPDAMVPARLLARRGDVGGWRAFAALARSGQLLDLGVANRLAADARGEPDPRLGGQTARPPGEDAAQLPAAGRQALDDLGRILGRPVVPGPADAGLATQVRGRVAVGVAAGLGVGWDHDARDRLLESFDHTRPTLARHAGPAAGDVADASRAWLYEARASMRDRRGVLLPCAYDPDRGQRADVLARQPLWALGRKNLLARADVERLDALLHALRGTSLDRLHPEYGTLPGLSASGPDLFAYRRLRGGAGGLVRPGPGFSLLILRMEDLPVRALAALCERAGTGSALAAAIRAGAAPAAWAGGRLGLDEREATALLSLVPLGLEAAAAADLAAALFGVNWRATRVHELTGRLLADVCPELTAYLADRTAGLVAPRFELDEAQLLEAVGYDDGVAAALRGNGGLTEYLYKAGFVECLVRPLLLRRQGWNIVVANARHVRHQVLATPPPGETWPGSWSSQQMRAGISREQFLRAFAGWVAERVELPTGRVRASLSWVEARAAFVDAAEDAFKEALFAVVEAGHRLVAFAPFEVVVEIPEGRPEHEDVGLVRTVAAAAGTALGGLPVACDHERVFRW